MPHPFPGMNPWLERPGLWQDVHDSLIVAIRDALSPAVLPKYYIAIQERAVITALTEDDGDRVVGKPDVAAVLSDEGVALRASAAMAVALAEPIEVSVPYDDQIAETYLEVYEAAAQRLVTVVEILSPTNKRPGKRRNEYEEKRAEILSTRTHFVEVDLLREWPPMPFYGDGRGSHYRILIRRNTQRGRAGLYAFNVREPIPQFRLPLLKGDPEPIVDLGALLHALYDRVGYRLRVDYTRPPAPPLSEADAAWAAERLTENVPGAD